MTLPASIDLVGNSLPANRGNWDGARQSGLMHDTHVLIFDVSRLYELSKLGAGSRLQLSPERGGVYRLRRPHAEAECVMGCEPFLHGFYSFMGDSRTPYPTVVARGAGLRLTVPEWETLTE